jgi:hypothetical protein
MNSYKVEIYTKGHRLAASYTADAESGKYLIDATLQDIEKYPWVTFSPDEDMSLSIRVSEIENVKVTRI